MPLTTDQPAASIEEDIPCTSCGYDLRGLQTDGRCPECNQPILPSVRAYVLRRADLPDPLEEADPRWVRSIAEGASLQLLSFSLMLALAFAPSSAYAFRTTQRTAMLAVACTMWVCGAYGAWKLATPDPLARRWLTRTGFWLRIFLIANSLLLTLMIARRYSDGVLAVMILCLLMTLMLGPTYYVVVAGLTRRMWLSPERLVNGVEYVAGVVSFLLGLLLFFGLGGFQEPDSLSILMAIPTPAFSAQDVVRWIGNEPFHPLVIVLDIYYALLLVYHIIVCAGLWRAFAKARSAFIPQSP